MRPIDARRYAAACLALATVAAIFGLATGRFAPTPAEDLHRSGLGCWTEPNPSQPNGTEEVCGPLHLMPAGAVEIIAEDDPRWDCRTMGNRLCGPGTGYESDGRYAVCGVVTEDGVTEHLDAYAERCGR